jgi:hypothetical protein
MITQPSASRIIDVVKRDLDEHVLPALTDQQAQSSVQMIQHILSTLQVRVEHEIAWLHEEIEAVDALADQVLGEHPDAVVVSAALDALRADRGGSYHYVDLCRRYALASEVLSASSDAVPAGSPVRAAVEAQLDLRLAHEAEIIGDFSLVGRS